MQMTRPIYRFILILAFLGYSSWISAQDWKLEKDVDGIKIYTRDEPGSNNKAFKGITEVQASVDEVCAILEDVEQCDEWDEDVKEIKVFEHEQGKMFRYYISYEVPWPFQDRDLCLESVFTTDPATGNRQLKTKSIPDALPVEEDMVRMINYWQCWTLIAKPNGITEIVMEGFADPAGSIPSWVANMAVTGSPLKMLQNIRKELQ